MTEFAVQIASDWSVSLSDQLQCQTGSEANRNLKLNSFRLKSLDHLENDGWGPKVWFRGMYSSHSRDAEAVHGADLSLLNTFDFSAIEEMDPSIGECTTDDGNIDV